MKVTYPYIQGFGSQPVALTVRTAGASPVTGKQYPVLHLVQIPFHLFKKIVDPVDLFIAFP
jgi:hypothetical protein